MDTEFYIDVRNPDGSRVGSGPIVSATGWSSTRRMDRAGKVSFAVPMSDRKSELLRSKQRVTCYRFGAGGPEYVGGGIIDQLEIDPREDGGVELAVSGNDMLRELMRRSVHFLALRSGWNPMSHTNALAAIAAYAPTGWTFIPAAGAGDVYYQFNGSSVLNALTKLAELSDSHFYLSGEREVTFQTGFDASGIRAVEAPLVQPEEMDNVSFLANFALEEESYDRISRIYPYGHGTRGAALNLSSTTRTAPAGYTLDKANNFLRHDATETEYDRDERLIQWYDIEPLDADDDDVSTPAEVEAAANQLFDRALAELSRRIYAKQTYKLALAFCPLSLRPLQNLRCVFRRALDGRNVVNVNQLLNILEATTDIDEEGLRTTGLTVAVVDRYPERETNPIVQLFQDRQAR